MNRFKQIISSLLTITFFLHTCVPAYGFWDDIDDIEKNKKILESGAIPGSLNFKADPKQTAAGCLFYAHHHGEIKFLFGFRDDQDTYCNPGGKSDLSDKGLHFTGGRESGEESFNIYAPHPEILKHKPFVDLYSMKENTPFLNRMYFVEQEYIDAEIFNKRLQDPNLSGHQKEYRHFKWVPAKDLLKAVQNKKNTFKISGEEEIALFEPLYQTLLTETSQSLLKHLVEDKAIPMFTRQKNRVHMEGVHNIDSSFKISWKNNFERTITSKNLSITQKIVSDEKEDRFVLGKAVAAKGAANLEIKRMFSQPVNLEKHRIQRQHLLELDQRYFEKNKQDFKLKDQSKLNQPRVLPVKKVPAKNIPIKKTPLKNMPLKTQPSNTLSIKDNSPTLSDLLLQAQLGDKYVKPVNPTDPRSRHEADVKNLKLYQKKYSKVEGELKRGTKPLETDYARVAHAIELERSYKNWIALHHASAPEIKYFWVAGTVLRALLSLESVANGTNPYMRTTDIYVRGLGTMEDCIKRGGTQDYEGKNASMRLCGNMAVTSGLSTTHTSSSSVEYFYNAHSVAMPNAVKRFEESTQLIGMTDTSYLPYQSVYEQFFGCVSKDVPNSAWTVVFIKPELLDTYGYPAHGGGRPFTVDSPSTDSHIAPNSKKVKIPSALGLYKQAKEELTIKSLSSSEKKISTNKLVADSIAEIRLLLNPSLMTDPNKVRVHSFDRFPLNKNQQKKFKNQLTAITINDVGRWLSQHTKVMKDSLYKDPALKKLYALVHRDIMEKDVVETVSAEAFPHLIKNGHHEGARQFFESYGDILKTLKLSSYDLAFSALNSGSVETFKFVLNDFLKTSADKIFSTKDIKVFVKKCLLLGEGFSENYAFLFKNYDMQKIDKNIRHQWGIDVLKNGSSDTLNTFHETIYPLTSGMLDESLSNIMKKELFPLNLLQGLLKFRYLSKENIIETLLKYLAPEFKNKGVIEDLVKSFLKEGFDYKKPLPNSGNPLLFYLPGFYFNPDNCLDDKTFLQILANDKKLTDIQNKEGLNIIQFMQKQFLEGYEYPSIYHFRKEVFKKEMKDFQPYQPFFEEFGMFDSFNMLFSSPFKNENFSQWHSDLENAIKFNSLTQVIKVFENCPEYRYLDLYKMKNPTDYLLHTRSNKVLDTSAHQKWMVHFTKLIQEGKYKELFLNIDLMNEKEGYIIYIQNLFSKNIPSMSDLNRKTNEKTVWINIFELLKSPENFRKALQENKISQKLLMDNASFFLKDENENLILEALTKVFPNPSDLLKGTFKERILQILKFDQPKVIKILLKYIGCFSLLSQLSEEQYGLFIKTPFKDLLTFVQKESPEIFTYQDKDKNFLKFSLECEYLRTFKFVKNNLKELKKAYTDDGIPVLFLLGTNPEILMKVIQLDPSVLLIKTKDGLTAQDLLLANADPEDNDYEMLKKLLTPVTVENSNILKLDTPVKQPVKLQPVKKGMVKKETIKKAVKLPLKVKQTNTTTTKQVEIPVKQTTLPTKQIGLPVKTLPKLPAKKVGIPLKKEPAKLPLVKKNVPIKKNTGFVKEPNTFKNQVKNTIKNPPLKRVPVKQNND